MEKIHCGAKEENRTEDWNCVRYSKRVFFTLFLDSPATPLTYGVGHCFICLLGFRVHFCNLYLKLIEKIV